MATADRKYFIDWIRVIAIALLLIYHVAIAFQRWGIMIGFIANPDPWDSLWLPMTMLNVWRIPLLFFVSGMGVYFAIQNRNWKQLIQERALRIFLPFVFGIFVIVPIHQYLWRWNYSFEQVYSPNPGHLWFLGNIFAYVLMLLPVFIYLKKHENGKVVQLIKKMLSTPLGLIPVFAALVAEGMLLDPRPFELYAMTWHGFVLGLLAFFFGFCFVMSGSVFWDMVWRWRWMLLGLAVILYGLRLFYFQTQFTPNYLIAIESNCWILSVFAFGSKYLNRSGHSLKYLSQAAYPVYILHMIFLSIGSLLIFPLDIPVQLEFFLVLAFTFAGCFGMYELIRRVNIIRPLFGLKMKAAATAVPSVSA